MGSTPVKDSDSFFGFVGSKVIRLENGFFIYYRDQLAHVLDILDRKCRCRNHRLKGSVTNKFLQLSHRITVKNMAGRGVCRLV